MKNMLLLVFILYSWTILGVEISEPTAEFTGIGRIKVPADYISLSMSVHSECYPTPLAAQQATDGVVEKIDQYLQTLKTPKDRLYKILVSGGVTSRFSKWQTVYQVHQGQKIGGQESKEICRNTFQKSTDITVKIGATKNFSQIFAQIQTESLKYFQDEADRRNIDQPQTFVNLGTPEPQITQEHRTSLEREARHLALLDAKANFKSAIKSCGKQRGKVLSIRETGVKPVFAARPHFHRAIAVPASAASEDTQAPVRFDDLQITMELTVSFQFEGALCFEDLSY